ncbi:hypothetical protein PRIPAC_72563 [Pristionchus pacificus]|nr:hypothetical protein PRIPAC_72563 [Pristionchus pacificus]
MNYAISNPDIHCYIFIFCCSKIPALAQPINGWQSHARNELDTLHDCQITPVIPSSTINCPYCNKTEKITETDDSVIIEHPHLFSFSCGHAACRSCWLSHARRNAMNRTAFIHCINSNCTYTSTTTERAVLFSDATIDIFHSIWWE